MIRVAHSHPTRSGHALWKAWASGLPQSRGHEAFRQKLLGVAQAGFFEHQRRAFDRVLAGESVFLTAGTSSGKTFAAALPLLEQLATRQIRRVCLVYPTRALLESQRADVGELAALRGLTSGVAMGGKTVSGLLDAMASRVVFATPDQIYWYFAKTVKHAGALAWSLTQVDDFVFDEIHVFRSYALGNLTWFLRRLQELNPKARFHFLSATTAPELFERLKCFGDFGQPIHGESFTGALQVEFAPWGPITWRQRDQVLQYVSAAEGGHTVAIFNSARFVHRFSLQYGARNDTGSYLAGTDRRLFRYTGYMEKAARDGVIGEFQETGGALLTTSAAEVGVDFDCDRLLMEECGAESTVQRFGRAGRGGRPAHVMIVAEPGLEDRVREHLTSDEPSRGEFVNALSQALGGFEHLAKTSQLGAYSQYFVNVKLGSTGQVLNQRLFSDDERARFDSWVADGNLLHYGLRSVMPQVTLAEGVGADPFYILQLAPKGSLRPPEDPRFDLAVIDRSYDSLVWQPFAFDVSVDTVATFRRSRLVDAHEGRLTRCEAPRPDRLHALWPKGSSRFIARPEGPIFNLGGVRVGLCFGDVVLRRVANGDSVMSDPELAIRGWYYLLLASEDVTALGSLLWRLVYPDGNEDDGPSGAWDRGHGQRFSFNRGTLADLAVVRATGPPHYAFVLETAYGACYEVWRELCEQRDH